MRGKLFVEKTEEGHTFIVFSVDNTETVNKLTVDMLDTGLDILYEPKVTGKGYESCFICTEETAIKIRARTAGWTPDRTLL